MFIPNLRVKWPNDILSGNFKICGILIENNLKNDIIQSSIIGFGLNVNQLEFGNLKKASSLKFKDPSSTAPGAKFVMEKSLFDWVKMSMPVVPG